MASTFDVSAIGWADVEFARGASEGHSVDSEAPPLLRRECDIRFAEVLEEAFGNPFALYDGVSGELLVRNQEPQIDW